MMKSTSQTEVVGATPIALGENREELAQLLEKITSGIVCTEQEKHDFSDFFYCMDELTFSHELEKKMFLLLLNAIANDDEFYCIPLDFEWILDLHTGALLGGNRTLFAIFSMKPHRKYIKIKKEYNKDIIWRIIENKLAEEFKIECKRLREIRKAYVFDTDLNFAWNLFPFWLLKKYPNIFIEKSSMPRRYDEIKHIPFKKIALYLPEFILRGFECYCDNKFIIKYIKYLGEGFNIRKSSFIPFKLTKKMAFHFHDLKIDTEVRRTLIRPEKNRVFKLLEKRHHMNIASFFQYPFIYAFVKGQGGDDRLVSQFNGIYSRIDDYDFQKSIIDFFVRFHVRNSNELRRLLGYISHMRHESGRTYSLKGRTLASVTRNANEYYEEQQRAVDRASLLKSGMLNAKWRGADYKNYHKEDESGEYQIIQLLESMDLVKEGRVMSHCVRTYIGKCMTRRCSIWSLRKKEVLGDDSEKWKSLATIEVNSFHQIIQAKARYNYKPVQKHMEMIEEWAAMEGIKIIAQ